MVGLDDPGGLPRAAEFPWAGMVPPFRRGKGLLVIEPKNGSQRIGSIFRVRAKINWPFGGSAVWSEARREKVAPSSPSTAGQESLDILNCSTTDFARKILKGFRLPAQTTEVSRQTKY